ncbi:hypothetical protein QFZ37_002067 [Chryseobacterium ginsenosidimutans]|uniref:hypothetical protein n=1 Tax=Chryseobacterium ginsenosidimutans TaxID=687846 RepID=UPI00277FF10C|nr:hypothetical protein [Chryseobacterium ginsenosidimutans]MDQ0593698.1 hypothetical protein [Chryseobacterium ginsenosidimutans]
MDFVDGGGNGPTSKNSTGPGIIERIGNFFSNLFGGRKKVSGTITGFGPLEKIPLEEEKTDGSWLLLSAILFGNTDPYSAIGNAGVGPYAEERENVGAVAMIFINPEAGAEGLLKNTVTKAGSRSLVNLTEETFSQALYKGVENVGGYSIYGTKGLVGNTFNRNVFLLEASGTKSLSGFRSLFGSMEAEAIGAGASKISIYGSSVINQGLLNPSIAQRFGYSFEKIGNGIILQKALK